MMAAHTDSPMPMPCLPPDEVSCVRVVPVKRVLSRSFGMPQPLSMTSNTARCPSVNTRSVRQVIPLAWSTAFSKRFVSTCWMSMESIGMTMKSSGSFTSTGTPGWSFWNRTSTVSTSSSSTVGVFWMATPSASMRVTESRFSTIRLSHWASAQASERSFIFCSRPSES